MYSGRLQEAGWMLGVDDMAQSFGMVHNAQMTARERDLKE